MSRTASELVYKVIYFALFFVHFWFIFGSKQENATITPFVFAYFIIAGVMTALVHINKAWIRWFSWIPGFILGICILSTWFVNPNYFAVVGWTLNYLFIFVVLDRLIRWLFNKFIARGGSSLTWTKGTPLPGAPTATFTPHQTQRPTQPVWPGFQPQGSTRRQTPGVSHGFTPFYNFSSWCKPGTPVQKVGSSYIVGKPGTNLSTGDAFGERETAQGIEGEMRTMEDVVDFLHRKGASAVLFNSLAFEGSKRADVDHMLVVGRNAFGIDSKYYGKGIYSMDADGNILKNSTKYEEGNPNPVRYNKIIPNSMGAAHDKSLTALQRVVPGVRMQTYVALQAFEGRWDKMTVRWSNNLMDTVRLGTISDVLNDIDNIVKSNGGWNQPADPRIVEFYSRRVK